MPNSPFSFLPLSNKPGLRASVQAKQNKTAASTLPEFRGKRNSEVEMKDKDDEWYDCTSSEDGSPLKRSKSADNIANSLVTVNPPSAEEEAQLLPYMPSLFGKELPPCGAGVQVAYENVSQRLRTLWLNHRGRLAPADICKAVSADLNRQQKQRPFGSLRGVPKRRVPWRRENVFKFELSWIAYFLREAQTLATLEMTESEIMDRKMRSPVPTELGFNISRPDCLKLWDTWNDRKRKPTPQLPEEDLGSEENTPNGTVEPTTNEKVEENSTVNMSDASLVESVTDAEKTALP
ncbi:hypothetical protein P154DRAFT_559930 [Amniculicola lignicola CBS 123094]|uniref:Uncharacterized protein n=1 Tax=Amniculicola lignicola CBS 123094 TaxID=1392246 RepID=A0A6A5WUA2_9PLEO|nr:hypothetical protein P154DRAFT_559930 [Amniculicola lignicola CBS 123094]